MKKFKTGFFLIILFIIAVGYIYYVHNLVDDEFFNYGYAVSIKKGLIPYLDFNMIVPPLFAYLTSIFIKLFGEYLIVYHLLIGIIIVLIWLINYKLIKNYSFVIYLLLLVYPYTGYNMFVLLLLFCLLYFDKKKYSNWLEPVLISLMFLSKQTLGILVIPSLIFAKNKKQTLAIYLLFIFSFLLYLVSMGSVLSFFDYCLFGMFDFASKNQSSINLFFISEIIIILTLSYFAVKTKRKDITYILFFQIVCFPIVNLCHFIISFIPVAYLTFKEVKNKYYSYLIAIFLLSFLCQSFYPSLKSYQYVENNHSISFMKGRAMHFNFNEQFTKMKDIYYGYEDYDFYVFGLVSYMLKLDLNLDINKYDNINNGNMGYNGSNKYIEEIDKNCQSNKCSFIIYGYNDSIEKSQINRNIVEYVHQNYYQVYCNNLYNVYISKP